MLQQTRMLLRFNAIIIAPEAATANINVPRPNVPAVIFVRAELERTVAQEARHRTALSVLIGILVSLRLVGQHSATQITAGLPAPRLSNYAAREN
jgi:hypothetical protein